MLLSTLFLQGDEMLHFIVLLFNSYNNERREIQTLILSKLYMPLNYKAVGKEMILKLKLIEIYYFQIDYVQITFIIESW